MKHLAIVSLALVLVLVAPTYAGVVNHSDVGGYRAFQDTSSGLVWLDLDNFWGGTTYNSLNALLSSSGFHIATTAELAGLQSSIPAVPANFASEVLVVGGNYVGHPTAGISRNLIWGIYEDGNAADGVSYSWKFDTDTNWNFSSNSVGVNDAFTSQNPDLGAFVVANAPVPEPGTWLLFGLGATGLVLFRRRCPARR